MDINLRDIIIDPLKDMWSLFCCDECGLVFFYEEMVQTHIKKSHKMRSEEEYKSIEVIVLQQPICDIQREMR